MVRRRVVLLEAWPRDPADGSTKPFRVIGGSATRADHFGVQWIPAISTFPRLTTRLGFNGREFGTGAVATVGEVYVSLGHGSLDPFLSMIWANAAVTIHIGWDGGDDGDFTTFWAGRAASIRQEGERMVITLADPAEELRKPVLEERFAGTGDLEGPEDLAGRLKPVAWGPCEQVPGILIDPAYNIWMLVKGPSMIVTVMDGGVPYDDGPNVADLAALRAVSVPQGAVATCEALSLVRPWTPPKLKLTADIVATLAATAADIADAIVTSRTGISFAPGQVAAFNVLQPAAIGTYIEDDRSIGEELDRIFSGLGSWWRLNAAGQLELGRFGFDTFPTVKVERGIISLERREVIPPTRRRLVGYRRNFSPFAPSEIAAAITSGDIDGLGALATLNEVLWQTHVVGMGKPADYATVGAPAGTLVGSTPAEVVEAGGNAANAGLNADGTVKPGKVPNTALQDAAVTTNKLANLSVNTDKLADLAVTARALANSSVEANKIANAAVGSAAIASLAVGTAHIANGAISTAKIGDLAVNTLKIADNAVTVPVSFYNVAEVTLPAAGANAWLTVASLTFTSSGGRVFLVFTGRFRSSGSMDWIDVRITRGGSQIFWPGAVNTPTTGQPLQAISFSELPPAGTHLYEVQCKHSVPAATCLVGARSFFAMETKK